jgi:hypothetical protein
MIKPNKGWQHKQICDQTSSTKPVRLSSVREVAAVTGWVKVRGEPGRTLCSLKSRLKYHSFHTGPRVSGFLPVARDMRCHKAYRTLCTDTDTPTLCPCHTPDLKSQEGTGKGVKDRDTTRGRVMERAFPGSMTGKKVTLFCLLAASLNKGLIKIWSVTSVLIVLALDASY